MKPNILLAAGLFVVAFISAVHADVVRTEANNGNLIMEDIPPIPQSIVADLNRYQNVRSAGFRDWTEDGEGIFITTRFGDVSQLHHVGHPGGARTQITFLDEPIGSVSRQPHGSAVARRARSPRPPAAPPQGIAPHPQRRLKNPRGSRFQRGPLFQFHFRPL